MTSTERAIQAAAEALEDSPLGNESLDRRMGYARNVIRAALDSGELHAADECPQDEALKALEDAEAELVDMKAKIESGEIGPTQFDGGWGKGLPSTDPPLSRWEMGEAEA